MRLEEFKAEHVMQLDLQPSQRWMVEHLKLEGLRPLEGHGYTAVDDGRPIACAGITPYWEGRYLGWSFLGRMTNRQMVHVTRYVKAFLGMAKFRRLEISVDCDYPAAHAWARHLGFELETPRARKFDVDGRDCSIYVMVR